MDNSNHSNEETFTPPVPPSQYTQSEAPVFSQPPQTAPVNPVQAGEQPVAAVPPQSGTGGPQNAAAPGQPIYSQQPPIMPNSNPTDGLGIASMVLGIISILLCCCYGFGLMLAIPGLILGLVAKKSLATGKRSGFALAGIIISAISCGLNLLFLFLFVLELYQISINGELDSLINEIYGSQSWT